jgi:hypothetical protein
LAVRVPDGLVADPAYAAELLNAVEDLLLALKTLVSDGR